LLTYNVGRVGGKPVNALNTQECFFFFFFSFFF